ncbi:uncharacterized protein LOC132733978 [Ruditapes philippinarum]|uniref:uncharacterized protein LOC132733978 n=1 Tax=Ruditapes philippinarum TaxID=129788 RepID=UPI00295B1710|nr:uncharacterized protein LOC132733978 [Ruditapes philippinarum]
MEDTLSTYFFRALTVLGIFALTNGQFGGYGRRRIIPRRIYPRYPMGGGLIDPYSRGSIIGDPYVDPYIGTDTLGGGIYPGGGIGVIGGRRRPVVVDDSSRRNAQDINVSNNNVNVERSTGSDNVHVNQVTNTRTCECQTGHIMGGQCGPYQQCVSDSCSGGGGNGVCRDTGIGGPMMGGPVMGGPVMGGFDGHGHGGW